MNVNQKKSTENIGELISTGFFKTLSGGFKSRFPREMPAVFLSKQAVLDCIKDVPGVSGIAFRYGLENPADPHSKRMILIPCTGSVYANGWADQTVLKEGYVCENGERISLDRTWELFGNYTRHMHQQYAFMVYSKIQVGYFWGINNIKNLLATENCHGLRFHFGYNPTFPVPAKRFQDVLEVVDANKKSLDIYMEYGQCCQGGSDTDTYIFEQITSSYAGKNAATQLTGLRQFMDGYVMEQQQDHGLYEMYRNLSNPLAKAISARPDADMICSILYANQLQQLYALIANNQLEAASKLFRNTLTGLLDQYIFRSAPQATCVAK